MSEFYKKEDDSVEVHDSLPKIKVGETQEAEKGVLPECSSHEEQDDLIYIEDVSEFIKKRGADVYEESLENELVKSEQMKSEYVDLEEDHDDVPVKEQKKINRSFIGAGVVLIIVVLLVIWWVYESSIEKSDQQQQASQSLMTYPERVEQNGVGQSQITLPESSTSVDTSASLSSDKDQSPLIHEIVPPTVNPSPTTKTIQAQKENKKRVNVPGQIVDLLDQAYSNNDQEARALAILQNNSATNLEQHQVIFPISRFTVQLAAGENEDKLWALARHYNLNHYWIYEARHQDKSWFILIMGEYMTSEQASQAMKMLPDGLKRLHPWVKSGLKVEQERKQGLQ